MALVRWRPGSTGTAARHAATEVELVAEARREGAPRVEEDGGLASWPLRSERTRSTPAVVPTAAAKTLNQTRSDALLIEAPKESPQESLPDQAAHRKDLRESQARANEPSLHRCIA